MKHFSACYIEIVKQPNPNKCKQVLAQWGHMASVVANSHQERDGDDLTVIFSPYFESCPSLSSGSLSS